MSFERIKNLIVAEQEDIARNSPYKSKYMSAYYDGFNSALSVIKQIIAEIESEKPVEKWDWENCQQGENNEL